MFLDINFKNNFTTTTDKIRFEPNLSTKNYKEIWQSF